jgi:GDP-L-fucose synthase
LTGRRAAVDSYWHNKRILITGGAGFIGSYVAEGLVRRGVRREDIVVPRSAECDLRVRENCRRAVAGCQIVLHLAAQTGGIAFSRAHPASQYYNCSLMNLYMMEAAREAGVEKFVSMGNLLVYPARAPSPLREEDVHDGKIAETHLGVGLAKRDLVLMAQMYHAEYGMSAVGVLAANAYGPRDRFDPAHSHVIPATIVKCFQEKELMVWGDGKPTRDFLYVEDLAEGLLECAEKLEPPQFVNLASGTEISIGDLVHLIARLTGFTGRIIFDPSKGAGDPRRVASVERVEKAVGFRSRFSMEEGLRRTIAWYKAEARK